VTAGQRFARFTTDVLVRRPVLWPLLRGPVRRLFDRLAADWEALRGPDHLAPYEAGLQTIPEPPARALDLGTGTGAGARAIAGRWPETAVVGVDLAEAMIAEARRRVPGDLAGRVTFAVGDAAALPYPDGAFDLVTLANAIPFFDELARVVAPGGHVLFSYSRGPATPIYVPDARLRAELERRGFGELRTLGAGSGTAIVARKGGRR
jgi:ubiquinone/menaquinone biosynthesis C-methylase UbiE